MWPVLLLYELVGPDPFRHYRNEAFPFAMGLCRAAGRPAVWKTSGVEQREGGAERFFVDLDEAGRRDLCEAISSLGATRVVLNESLKEELVTYLRGSFPHVTFSSVGDLPPPSQGALKEGFVRGLASFLGLAPGELTGIRPNGYVLDGIEPCYAREPVASSLLPELVFLRVLVGAECAHSSPLSRNERFAGIDLARATHDRGCSFCMGGASWRESRSFVLPPLDMAFRQIECAARDVKDMPALRRLHSLPDGRLMFLVQGAVVFQMLEAFINRLVETDLPPSAFLFSCRADELLARGRVIEELLPRLESRGHALHVWVMGIENFSRAENERLNKGIEPEQVLDARLLIDRLEADHPDAFCFNRYGGFSFVLFTPWTTLDDLRTNLSWARRVGIAPGGFFLRSRVQLVKGTPIALLAERDGLVVERFSEPYFDSGCIRSHHDQELSWRFRSPMTAAVYRLGSRLPPEALDLSGDDLYEKVQAGLWPYYRRGLDAFDAFESLLDLVEAEPGDPDDDELPARLLSCMGELLRCRGAGSSGLDPERSRDRLMDVGPELREAGCRIADYLDGNKRHRVLDYELAHVVEHVHEDGSRELRLDMRSAADELFQIIVERRVGDRRYLAGGGGYGIGYARSTPPSSKARADLMRAVARVVGGELP